MRHCVDTGNDQAVQALADRACMPIQGDGIVSQPCAAQMMLDPNGRSPLRAAAQGRRIVMVAAILNMYAAALRDPRRGYRVAVHAELAPTLNSDLVYICKHAPSCFNLVIKFLQRHGTVLVRTYGGSRGLPWQPHLRLLTVYRSFGTFDVVSRAALHVSVKAHKRLQWS